MGPRTSHTPGTFSWVDLATTDLASAKAFYGDLFGWTLEDGDTGTGSVYTTARMGDAAVAGLFEHPDMPPAWTSYITVAEADAAGPRAEELGGGTVQPAFDVVDAGRMAILHDPAGAVFAVWEPRARIGAEHVNDVGALTMNELSTNDLDGARSFYGDLFGWTSEDVDTGPDGPVMVAVSNDGRLNASLTVDTASPPHWRPYFTVESTEASLARIAELGGSTVVGPIPIPDGSIGIATDPQGALFCLFEGEVDP